MIFFSSPLIASQASTERVIGEGHRAWRASRARSSPRPRAERSSSSTPLERDSCRAWRAPLDLEVLEPRAPGARGSWAHVPVSVSATCPSHYTKERAIPERIDTSTVDSCRRELEPMHQEHAHYTRHRVECTHQRVECMHSEFTE